MKSLRSHRFAPRFPSSRNVRWLGLILLAAWGAILASALANRPAIALIDPTLTPAPTARLGLLEAIVLGLVQGLTEFLPISSTAHLKVVPVALGWGDPGVAFTAFIQLGSIVAVLGYFWADLKAIAQGSWQAIAQRNWHAHEFRLALGIGLGTLPILVGGLAIKKFIPDFDHSPLRSLTAIALASMGMALLLAVAEVVGSRHRSYEKLDLRDGVIMGTAQALALIPGVSRSGSTLTAGLFSGMERAAAARFSFLLGIPAIVIAGVVESVGVVRSGELSGGDLGIWGVGLAVAALSSYAAIAWLLKFLQTQNTWVFVIYRLLFGAAILTAVALGSLEG